MTIMYIEIRCHAGGCAEFQVIQPEQSEWLEWVEFDNDFASGHKPADKCFPNMHPADLEFLETGFCKLHNF